MKITHVTFSPVGGAGVVALRMVRAQQELGLDSHLSTAINSSVSPRTIVRPWLFSTAVFDFFIVRKSRKTPLFSLFRKSSSSVLNKLNQSDSVLHLHWTPGALDLEQLATLLKQNGKCVWTLHDMWAFTGGCHHSQECDGYQIGCSSCPQVRPQFQNAVVRQAQLKKSIYSDAKNLIVVCPSLWLKNLAQQSDIFRDREIEVIYNPVPSEYFLNRQDSQKILTEPSNDLIVVFVANDVTDPNKNLEAVIDIVENANADQSVSAGQIRLKVIGNGSSPRESEFVEVVGPIKDPQVLAQQMSEAHVLINFSDSENFPNVIAESLACGTPVVGRNVGGIPELVRDGETGFLVESKQQAVERLAQLFTDRVLLEKMSHLAHNWAVEHLEDKAIMRKYSELYGRLEN